MPVARCRSPPASDRNCCASPPRTAELTPAGAVLPDRCSRPIRRPDRPRHSRPACSVFQREESAMRLFVLGATGRTGVELVDLALTRHQVTAFVRSPGKVTRRDSRLAVVTGDVRKPEDVATALAGHDAVISALGPAPRQAIFGTTLMQDSASSTLRAMKSAGVRRFLVVSSALLFPGGGPGVGFFRTLINHHLRDSRRMEEL